jgi:hypothetical protein
LRKDAVPVGVGNVRKRPKRGSHLKARLGFSP